MKEYQTISKWEFFKQNKNLFIFFIVLLGGIAVRLYFILNLKIYADELYYAEASAVYSIRKIITIDHWIKDHGLAYYLFLKPFFLLTRDLEKIRLTNLLLYIASCFVVFRGFFLKQSRKFAILIILFLSFFDYFIYLNSQISPFNLALFFWICTFVILINYLTFSTPSTTSFIIFFAIFSSLGFYADYSFSYVYIGFFPLLILLFILNNKKAKTLFIALSINFILVLPGLVQILVNFNDINSLFHTYTYYEENFFRYFVYLSDILFLRLHNITSAVILFNILIISILLGYKNKESFFGILIFVTLCFLITSLVTLFTFGLFYFSIFGERTFWLIYFCVLTLLVSILDYIIRKKNVMIIGIYIAAFLLLIFIRMQNYYNSNIHSPIKPNKAVTDVYRKLDSLLFNEKKYIEKSKQIIIVNKAGPSFFYTWWNYYLSNNIYISQITSSVRDFLKAKQIKIIKNFKDIELDPKINEGSVLLFYFGTDEGEEVKEIKYLSELYDNLRIYEITIKGTPHRILNTKR